jgi:hypothetical protein
VEVAGGIPKGALAYGHPIVASVIGAFRELLKDGVLAAWCRPTPRRRSPAALAGLLADPEGTSGIEAVRRLA